jgi:hypothetical protein
MFMRDCRSQYKAWKIAQEEAAALGEAKENRPPSAAAPTDEPKILHLNKNPCLVAAPNTYLPSRAVERFVGGVANSAH